MLYVWFGLAQSAFSQLRPGHMPILLHTAVHGNLVIEQHDSTKLLLIMRCFDHHRCEQLQSLNCELELHHVVNTTVYCWLNEYICTVNIPPFCLLLSCS